MAINTVKATERARTGSGALNAMRREGFVPAVVYGASENQNVKVNAKEFRDMLNASPSSQILLNLEVEGGKTQRVFIQDLQFDAITGAILHADFLAVTDNTVLTAKLPVVLQGEPAGIKLGGALEQLVHSTKVKALPNDLPETIEADVTGLGLAESLTIGDIDFPAGVTPTLDGRVLVALVAMTRAAKSAGAGTAE
ncbi:50S ribosomal protein L25 [Rubritalea marina]|uniref:50S ribosomal protein L25 n=1 Tax=Rubritalea marina TaxID=361055 RepID=UPI000365AF60|nr:50S ribosomal protein L25 [Rubritalea marina]